MKSLFLLFFVFFFTSCSYSAGKEEIYVQTHPDTYIINFEYGSANMNSDAVKQIQSLGKALKPNQKIALYGGIEYTGVPMNQMNITLARLKTTLRVLQTANVSLDQIAVNMLPAPARIGIDAPVNRKQDYHRIFMKID